MNRFPLSRLSVLLAVALLGGCGGDGDNATQVSAAQGGTVVSGDGGMTLTIPPGALSRDTGVSIQPVNVQPAAGSALVANGKTYVVSFDNGATLGAPMTVELAAIAAPTHPALGEIATQSAGGWTRLQSNFFRGSDKHVIGLASAPGTFVAVKRTLQAMTGDSVARGQDTFLHETFGNEAFFGGVLGLHTLLNNLTPAQAVGAGVQVDLAKVPSGIAAVLTGSDLAAKDAALQDPAITRALVQAGAVVGVKGVFPDPNSSMMSSAGITCALCHVNVTPTTFQLTGGATSLPIGPLAIDGRPNLAMNAGAILSLTPYVQTSAGLVATLQGWGPGKFDIRALPDNPLEDNAVNPTSTPPLWNFVDLEQQVYAYDWDGLFKSTATPNNSLASQAEAVYDLVMHANGAFGTSAGNVSPQLSVTPPATLLMALADAETAQPGNDIVTAKLMDVQDFERSITSPAPAAYDEALAQQGFLVFNGKANCVGCHRTAEFTGPVVSTRITLAAPTGGLAGGIKTPGLRGIAATAPYFHDGSAATLSDVVDVYSGRIVPVLSADEKKALVEYLKSL